MQAAEGQEGSFLQASPAPPSGLGVPASLSPPSSAPAPCSAKAKVSPGPSQFRPFTPGQFARASNAVARQFTIYCLVSTVTRRRRQRLPSAAPTRRRDVCPLLPLCPYLERRCWQGGAGSRTPAAPRPPTRLRPRAGPRNPGLRTPPPTLTLRGRAEAGVASFQGSLLVEAAVKA